MIVFYDSYQEIKLKKSCCHIYIRSTSNESHTVINVDLSKKFIKV